MASTNVSVADDVTREIGEQVSRVIRDRLPSWGNTSLDLTTGVDLYRSHIGTFSDLRDIRRNKDGSKNKNDNKVSGGSFEILDRDARRKEGREAYTTDELAELYNKNSEDPLFKRHPKLKEFAKTDHTQTDLVEVRPGGRITTSQHKLYENIDDGIEAFMKDRNNDCFVVPYDKYDDYMNKLNEKIKKGGDDAKRAKHIKRGLERSAISHEQAHHAIRFSTIQLTKDASKRITANVVTGVVSDVAVFACGGAMWEIRDAYQNPDTESLLDRCKRLILAIWQRLRDAVKDRSWREIGTEIIAGVVSMLTAPLKMARAAISRIIDILRRLWMDFVSGKIKTLADLIAACLKAIFVIASAGVALLLEAKLTPLMAAIPGGDVLAAVIAAVVAGVMIVIGNRFIDDVVRALFGIFSAGTRARMRRQEIQRICEEAIPRLIEDRERLQDLVDSHFTDREALLDATFKDMQSAHKHQDVDGFLKGLIKINEAYGKVLPWASFDEFDEFMLDDSRALKF